MTDTLKNFEWFNLAVYEIYVWWQDHGIGGKGWFYTAFGRYGKPDDELAAGRIDGCDDNDLDGAIERAVWELGGVLSPDMFARDTATGSAIWTRSEATPGPWRLDGDDFKHVGPRYHRISAGHGYSDSDPDKISRGFGLTGIISYADALLIASAPDLLEALIDLVDYAAGDLAADCAELPAPFAKALRAIDLATTTERKAQLGV